MCELLQLAIADSLRSYARIGELATGRSVRRSSRDPMPRENLEATTLEPFEAASTRLRLASIKGQDNRNRLPISDTT